MGKAKEIVKLRFKKLKNGEKSAYFDIYRNGVREYLWQDERLLPEDDDTAKEHNQKLILLFEERRRSLIAELTIDKSGIANRSFNTDLTLLQWLDLYEVELSQRASRSYIRGFSKLKDYLTGFNATVLLKEVNENFVTSFFEHLKAQPCTNHNERTHSFESCWDMLKKLGNSMNEAIRCRRFESIVNERYDFFDKEKQKGDFLAYFKKKAEEKNTKWENVYKYFERFVEGKCTFGEITVDLCVTL